MRSPHFRPCSNPRRYGAPWTLITGMDCDAKEHLFNTICISIQRDSRPSCTENRESEALVFQVARCLAMLDAHISLIRGKRLRKGGGSRLEQTPATQQARGSVPNAVWPKRILPNATVIYREATASSL